MQIIQIINQYGKHAWYKLNAHQLSKFHLTIKFNV